MTKVSFISIAVILLTLVAGGLVSASRTPYDNDYDSYGKRAHDHPYPRRYHPTPYALPCRHCLPIDGCRRLLGFAYADAIRYEAKQCGYNAYTDEVLICCPNPTPQKPLDVMYRREDFRRQQRSYEDDDEDRYRHRLTFPDRHTTEKPWVWDSQPLPGATDDDGGADDSTAQQGRRFSHWDTFAYSAGHQQHHHTYHTHHYDVPDNAIDEYHNEQHRRQPETSLPLSDAWMFDFEDPQTARNCPSSISADVALPDHLKDEAALPPMSVPGRPAATVLATGDDVAAPAVGQSDARPQPQLMVVNGPNCGVSISTRIIGGEDAGPGQFPWMARLAYRNRTSSTLSYRCAGSLISDRHVVTAAHCVTNLINQLQLVQVRLGELDITRTGDLCTDGQTNCMGAQDYPIDSVVHHSAYDTPKYANDIALIRLRRVRTVDFAPIALCLPIGTYAAADMAATSGIIAGWGATSADGIAQSGQLKWLRLPLTNTTSCASSYARFSANALTSIVVSERSQLCVQGSPNLDACQGDSGGPLMSDPSEPAAAAAAALDQRYTLLGLVSFGPRTCGVSNFPGVYTRVAAYTDWLLEHMSAASAS